jgi:hypothetical protein
LIVATGLDTPLASPVWRRFSERVVAQVRTKRLRRQM